MNRNDTGSAMMIFVRLMFSALCVCFSTSQAFAAGEYHPTFESPRALGRGNTFVAAFHSDESVRMNPASLAEAPAGDWELRWMQFDAFFSQNAVDTMGGLFTLASPSVDGILSLVEDKFGERHYARGQLFPLALRFGQFEITPYFLGMFQGEIRLPTTPEFYATADGGAGVNVSFGLNFNAMKVGLTTRLFSRAYFSGDVGALDLIEMGTSTSGSSDSYFEVGAGVGVGFDLGILYAPKGPLRFSLLVRDVGDSTYFDDATTIPNISQKILAGAGWRRQMGAWSLDVFADIHDLTNREGLNWLRLTKFGAEFGRPLWGQDHDLGVTLGLNDGYVSMGGYFDFWLGRFEITNYAVEAGTYPGQRMDRRWAMGFRTSTTL